MIAPEFLDFGKITFIISLKLPAIICNLKLGYHQSLIQRKCISFFEFFRERRGIVLVDEEIVHDEKVDAGIHEASQRIFRGTDERLAPHIEAGIDEDPKAGQVFELGQKLPESLIGIPGYRLDTGGVIQVGDGRDIGTQGVQAGIGVGTVRLGAR